MKKKLLLSFLLGCCLCSIALSGEPYQVQGHIGGVKSDSLIVFYMIPTTGESKSMVVAMNKGDFAFNVPIEGVSPLVIIERPVYTDPFGVLRNLGKPVRLIAMPGEQAIVKGTFDEFEISGTSYYQDVESVEGIIRPMQKQIDLLRMHQKSIPNDEVHADSLKSLQSEITRLENQLTDKVLGYIKANPKKDASAALISCLKNEDKQQAYDLLDDTVRNGVLGTYTALIVKAANDEIRTKAGKERSIEGAIAPDFTLKGLNGEAISLSSFRGKYVVLDFWGSWCVWCIKGFPEMKKSYEKHKAKMEFIGIACNDKDEAWRKAISNHQLPWINVFNDENINVPAMYGVDGYPSKCIINPEGKIVKMFSGESPEFYQFLDTLLAD